jgi:hypothetical protein
MVTCLDGSAIIVAVEACSHAYSQEVMLSVNKIIETAIKYFFNFWCLLSSINLTHFEHLLF